MINDRSILAVIPARGGSKGLPQKNIIKICGKPLIGWTIEAAQQSSYIDRIIVSSDDRSILAVAEKYDAKLPFLRPEALARDHTPSIDVVLHALAAIDEIYNYVILLQPTSPMRTVKNIDECVEFTTEKNAASCVSITPATKSPYWMFQLDSRDRIQPILENPVLLNRRQDLPVTYVLNGAIYLAETKWLQKNKTFINHQTIGYVMENVNSIDIDTEFDLLWFEFLIKTKQKKKR